MDEAAIEKLGAAPLAPHLRRIAPMKSKQELPPYSARTADGSGRRRSLLRLRLEPGFRRLDAGDRLRRRPGDSGCRTATTTTKDDDKSKEIRAQVRGARAPDVRPARRTPEAAARNAATVMAIETALAKASLTRVERRDPYKLFHKLNAARPARH